MTEPAATPPAIPDFTPVPRKPRSDGWKPELQRAFIEALAETGSVQAACNRIGKATRGAYHLRTQPGAEGFNLAWDAAQAHGLRAIADIAFQRAVEGVPSPVFYRGEQCGERRRYNDRLLMFILRHHDPDRYGGIPSLRPGTTSRAAREREAAQAEAAAQEWLAPVARGMHALLRQHRVNLRAAVLALLAGDQWGAADREHRARQLEDALTRDPGGWELAAELDKMENIPLRGEAEPDPGTTDPDHPNHCRPLGEAPNHGAPPPGARSIEDLPVNAKGALIPHLPIPKVMRDRLRIQYGRTHAEREAARKAALARVHAASEEWIAAENEADWEKWLRR